MGDAKGLLAAMKDHGADVQTYRGWDTYGWWSRCEAVLIHHTATASASTSNPVPSLGWLVSAYDKPAANMLVGKNPGTTYLCAAGPSYHCGQGGPWKWANIPGGNYPQYLFGIELDDPGVKVGSLTDYQVDNTARIVAGLWDYFGWTDPRSVSTHKCWTDGCHGHSPTPLPNRGRKNDTIDGAWGEHPGSDRPALYNAPWWRELVMEQLSGGGKPATWDGTIPSRAAARKAFHDQDVRNKAAWRLACRLYDLGYRGKPANELGQQKYPLEAVRRFRDAQGWNVGEGQPTENLWRRVFGKDKA